MENKHTRTFVASSELFSDFSVDISLYKVSTIDEQPKDTFRVGIGDSVVLSDLDSGEELRYMLVSPSEVDPVRGKISNASPIGKAVKGKEEGEVVEVAAPAGKLRYQIKRVEH